MNSIFNAETSLEFEATEVVLLFVFDGSKQTIYLI
jgi:hypothetical protein